MKIQEDAGIDIVTDGEQSRQHFVHGFVEGVEGIDFARRVPMGIRNNRYEAMVPTVTGALRRRGAHPRRRGADRPDPHAAPPQIHAPRADDDRRYGGRRALRRPRARWRWPLPTLLNEEARELAALGVDVIQFDEPAFNVYLDEVVAWGIGRCTAPPRASPARPRSTSATATASGQYRVEGDASAPNGGNTSAIFPALAASRIDQVSLECANSHVPIELLALLAGKDVLVGAIDVATDRVETPEEVAATIEEALRFVPAERLFPCTNCGMAPLDRSLAQRKLAALAAGAGLVRGRPPRRPE